MASKVIDEKKFFSQTSVPDKFEQYCQELRHFINYQEKLNRKIVLITSGGTTVPLESRTVRFIDNFSSGTRGSSSAEYHNAFLKYIVGPFILVYELIDSPKASAFKGVVGMAYWKKNDTCGRYFLKCGYAVIFLHRYKSLEPFSRHMNRNIFDSLQVTDTDNITVKDHIKHKLLEALKQNQLTETENLLLKLEFTTLGDYLHLLKAACESLGRVGNSVMLYLAAAVSDFYIPKADMSEHKIQSSNGPLELKLQLVPKMLEPLVKDWVPSAFVISFKLETDQNIIVSKSRQALQKYKHQLVIANILEKRKREVTLVTMDTEKPLVLSDEEFAQGTEIESYIVNEIIKLHDQYIATVTGTKNKT